MFKTCVSCKESKSNTKYDDNRAKCKKCRRVEALNRDRTFEGAIKRIYYGQVSRSKTRNHLAPSYSFKELRDWLIVNGFSKLYEEWAKSKYDRYSRPSCDRINNNKGYSLDNIELTTWGVNDQRGKKSRSGQGNIHAKTKNYYENNTVLRANFQRACKSHGWDFNSFDEIRSKEQYRGCFKYTYKQKTENRRIKNV